MKKLYKIGLAVIKNDKLLVLEPLETKSFKKRTKGNYIMPGGVPENKESYKECIKREIKEELGVKVNLSSLEFLGNFSDIAAGKENTTIEQDVYLGKLIGKPKPKGEIEKVVWFSKNDDWNLLSPIIRNKILPALIKKGYIKWVYGTKSF